MPHTALELIELGAVFFGLGLLGRLAGRIGLSPIPLYLLGGLAFGSGGLIPLGDIGDFTALAARSAWSSCCCCWAWSTRRPSWSPACGGPGLAGLLDIVLNAAPGAAVALILGWGPVGALVMAGVTYISSSGIIAKVLADLGRLGNRETPVVLSILVFEDLVMALYLPILTALLVGVSLLGRAHGGRHLGRGARRRCCSSRCATAATSRRSSTPRTARSSCSRCSGWRCSSRASRRRCRCPRPSARSCSASRSPAPPRETPPSCSNRCATCSPRCSSSSSG